MHRRTFLQKTALSAAIVRVPAIAQQVRQSNRNSGGESLSRQFARWVAGLRYEDLPPAVIDRAKGLTLQTLSSVLLGYQSPAAREAIKLVTEEEGGARNGATIMVYGTKATKEGAAYANAEMALAGGKWDTFRMLTHPGTCIIPAAFAAAEAVAASGKEFITGLVAGYEVTERMSADFIPTVMARGFHAGPVFGIFGAAVAAAKIMRLNEDQINNAVALCANLAGGNIESGDLREGGSARNAMFAVLLARAGHRGGETALEGNAGFYNAYAGNNQGYLTYSFTGERKADLNKITANLGKDWMFLETLYRIYSIPGYNIAHIDVTAKLCEEHNITYADVDRVEAVVNWLETQYPSPAFPTRREDIGEPRRGDTRYYAAYGVVQRGFPMLPFANDPPEVLELMKRVTIVPSHDMGLFAPRITIFTKDGKSYTKQATGREFIWDFNEEERRIRPIVPGIFIQPKQYDQLIATCRDLEQQRRADNLVQLTVK
ncbi:MAG: MmgE/PrpD family protein [Bryobacterales bacterium]|nr:MmgE/PrpD family protein [Bryobacterales bacterium]MBV9398427.1 MmgE/PrpD family protein [Bryobacterales bacterium]